MNDAAGRKGSRATRFLLWTVLVLLVAGLGAVFFFRWQGERRLSRAREEAAEQGRALVAARAETLARAIAVLGRDELAGGRIETLQESLDELIRGPGLVSISILDLDGRVLAATDRRALGQVREGEEVRRALGAQEISRGHGSVYLPVMGYTRRIATVHLEYEPGGGALLGGDGAPASDATGAP